LRLDRFEALVKRRELFGRDFLRFALGQCRQAEFDAVLDALPLSVFHPITADLDDPVFPVANRHYNRSERHGSGTGIFVTYGKEWLLR